MRILLYSRRKRLHNFFATLFAQGFTIQYKLMIYSKLRHFKGSQKVHKGSQESVNPLCEPYNKYNILYINKLWATHDQSCEAYVNPLKYATRWYSERLAYFVNPYNNLTPTLSEGEGDKPACVSCLNNYEEEPRKHLQRFSFLRNGCVSKLLKFENKFSITSSSHPSLTAETFSEINHDTSCL